MVKKYFGRTASRMAAVQALYQSEIVGIPVKEARHLFSVEQLKNNDHYEFKKLDQDLFYNILEGIIENRTAINEKIEPFLLDEKKQETNLLIKAILIAGTFELCIQKELAPAIIINEYLNIAKDFFTQKEASFINKVLDKLANPQA